eukprot:COSAG02_NODE_15719_length_1146_cov_1.861509_1_plen_70_part_10
MSHVYIFKSNPGKIWRRLVGAEPRYRAAIAGRVCATIGIVLCHLKEKSLLQQVTHAPQGLQMGTINCSVA